MKSARRVFFCRNDIILKFLLLHVEINIRVRICVQNLLTCLLCCPDCPNSIAILRKHEVFFAKKTELAGTRHASPFSREARWCEHQGAAVNYSVILPLLHSFKKEKSIMFDLVQQRQESRWVLLARRGYRPS